MKIRNILYIGTALMMAGCTGDEAVSVTGTSPSEERIPLRLEATLSDGASLTRAAGKDFEENDQLLAYIRHTTGGSKGSYTTTSADRAPLLVTFTKGSDAMAAVDANTNGTSDLTPTGTPLYWDDFSNSTTADTDLRTSGHGLQTFYGYCYNGGTPTTALDNENGTLGWTVQTNQGTAAAVKQSDLLWSAEQETVLYDHKNARDAVRDGLVIPYTHAMSEVTVELIAGDGFTGNPLGATVLKLNAMNTVTSLRAPTITVNSSATPVTITMCGDDYTSGLTRNYTAIVAPGTKLKVGNELLNITNVDGNDYTLAVTSAMVSKDEDSDNSNNLAWAKDHEVSTESTKDYILTKPGYNYHLTVTVNKTKIAVEARLTDWTTVNAEGTGSIDYTSVNFDMSGLNFADKSSVYIYNLQSDGTNNDEATERTSYELLTTSTYHSSTNKWTNSPEIYWPNKTNTYYFRAMSQNTTSVEQDNDVLWGITPAHGTAPNDYAKGTAIGPRTNEVPLSFEHAMSKVTFEVETTDEETATMNNTKVDLSQIASITISNLTTTGTINIEDGVITPGDLTANAISGTKGDIVREAGDRTYTVTSINGLEVVPQTITDASKVTITLTDGTTYSVKLNQCVLKNTETAIGAWERGKSYTYTIHIEKEQIQFRALIQDWVDKEGSGNANLEWD